MRWLLVALVTGVGLGLGSWALRWLHNSRQCVLGRCDPTTSDPLFPRERVSPRRNPPDQSKRDRAPAQVDLPKPQHHHSRAAAVTLLSAPRRPSRRRRSWNCYSQADAS